MTSIQIKLSALAGILALTATAAHGEGEKKEIRSWPSKVHCKAQVDYYDLTQKKINDALKNEEKDKLIIQEEGKYGPKGDASLKFEQTDTQVDYQVSFKYLDYGGNVAATKNLNVMAKVRLNGKIIASLGASQEFPHSALFHNFLVSVDNPVVEELQEERFNLPEEERKKTNGVDFIRQKLPMVKRLPSRFVLNCTVYSFETDKVKPGF
jgi:hypothetical protein